MELDLSVDPRTYTSSEAAFGIAVQVFHLSCSPRQGDQHRPLHKAWPKLGTVVIDTLEEKLTLGFHPWHAIVMHRSL